MIRYFFTALAILFLLVLCSAAMSVPQNTCAVTIVSPRAGELAAADVVVRGTATIPTAFRLWIFAHRRGLAIWWPQGGGAAVLEQHQFAVHVSLGIPQDIGSEFEIKAQILDASESAKIDSWFKRAEASGSYPGILLPPPIKVCSSMPMVIVKRGK